jgi:ectoine hydroxylase-related dioxygenase (phytanoyl-CoA dioxygenase family)
MERQPSTGAEELDKLLLELRVNGFCVLEGVVPGERCPAVRDSVSATVDRVGPNYPAPDGVGFVPGVINHDQSFAPYLADDRLLRLVAAVLGEHYRISFTSAIINKPGNARGKWHADWPYNQDNAGHLIAPYPDAVFHLTTLWMLSPFSGENGGTLVVPGSHRCATNPTAKNTIDPEKPFPTEMNTAGPAGSVLVMDSRLWHATAPNRTGQPRVALAVRYAPWWLNLEVLRPESDERKRMVAETGAAENQVPSVPPDVFQRLPARVKPLYRHWVAR